VKNIRGEEEAGRSRAAGETATVSWTGRPEERSKSARHVASEKKKERHTKRCRCGMTCRCGGCGASKLWENSHDEGGAGGEDEER
jgi:hypothetical protein